MSFAVDHTSSTAHKKISLGSLHNTPIAVGNGLALKYYHGNTVEHLENNAWVTKADFPFTEKFIYEYSTISLNNYLYMFGMA